MESKTIHFGHKNPKTRFLCVTSYHPISVNSKLYPTAFHYILSQKYIGLDEEIRSQPTVFLAKKVTKGEFCRNDWSKTKERVYRDALYYKFNQNKVLKTLLINTHPCKLVSEEDSLTARILMDVRLEFVSNTTQSKKKLTHTPSTKDFVVSSLSPDFAKLIQNVLDLCKRITKKEGCDLLYEEMLSDAFQMLFPKLKEFYSFLKDEEVGVVPNTFRIINHIQNLITIKVHKRSRSSIPRVLAIFLRWIKFSSTPKQRKYIFRRAEIIPSIEISLIPGNRPYRTKSVPILPPREEKPVVAKPVSNGKSLELVVGEFVVVKGRNLSKHAPDLLALGGKFDSDESSIHFDLSKQKELEYFVENNLEEDEIKAKKTNTVHIELLAFLHDVISRCNIEKTYLNVVAVMNLISKEDLDRKLSLDESVLSQLSKFEFDEACLSFVKKRLRFLASIPNPTDPEYVHKAHTYLFENIKLLNDALSKEDVWKVFMKDGKTLSTKEDIRRVSRVFSCIKLPPPPSTPPASPQPQRRQRRRPIIDKIEPVNIESSKVEGIGASSEVLENVGVQIVTEDPKSNTNPLP